MRAMRKRVSRSWNESCRILSSNSPPLSMSKQTTDRPMDLANMRENLVHSIAVYCLDCDHRAVVNVDQYPACWSVKSFEGRMRCCGCSSKRVHVRPAWNTY